MSDEQDLRALELIKQGGAERNAGLTLLVTNYEKPFRSYFIANGMSRPDAEEVSQTAFGKIIRYADDFRGEAPVLKGWLWRIAKNCFLDFIKAQKNKAAVSLDAQDDDGPVYEPAAKAELDPLQICVREALLRFAIDNEECAQAIAMSAISGMSTEEVAEFLQRTSGAAREYLSQCRKKLKPYMMDCKD